MRKIFLTININCQDEHFQQMEGVKRLNIGDIIKSKKLSFKPGELENNRGKLVAETISESTNHLLLGYAIQQKGQVSTIIQLLNEYKIIITKIYYDGGKRKEKEIKKYKEHYNLNSKWMDYSPEFIEHQYEEFEKVIMDIKIEAKQHNVEIMAI